MKKIALFPGYLLQCLQVTVKRNSQFNVVSQFNWLATRVPVDLRGAFGN